MGLSRYHEVFGVRASRGGWEIYALVLAKWPWVVEGTSKTCSTERGN